MSNPWLAGGGSSRNDSEDLTDPWSNPSDHALESSSNSLKPATESQPVDRHPLRSPSPNANGLLRRRDPSSSKSPSPSSGSASVASEWKAISAGISGLFTSSESKQYQWPQDPVAAQSTLTRRKDKAPVRSFNNSDSGTIPPHDLDGTKSKGHSEAFAGNTLNRLEGWLGLKQDARHKQPPTPSTSAASQETMVRVLIHPVAPTDTLSSLALHYGADIPTLRRSNKLWPGDAVQMRKLIYIPIDSCKHRPPNAEIKLLPSRDGAVSTSGGVSQGESMDLAFVPKEEEDDMGLSAAAQPLKTSTISLPVPAQDPASDFMPETNKNYVEELTEPPMSGGPSRVGSISRRGGGYPSSLSKANNGDTSTGPAPSLADLAPATNPRSKHTKNRSRAGSIGGDSNRSATASASASATSSGFVPPRGPIHVSRVPAEQLRFFGNSDKKGNGNEDKPSLGLGPGDPGYRPGESGLDDLLTAHRSQGTADVKNQSSISRGSLLRNVSGIPSESTSEVGADEDDNENWKPNVWKFGKSREPSSATAGNDGSGVPEPALNGGANGRSKAAPPGPPPRVVADSGSYQGWNDAPPPTAIVAKAYDGGAGYRKRQHQKHHRLLHDLAAGLPANTGAASKWARPINFGDSLPPAAPSKGSTASRGDTSGTGRPRMGGSSTGSGFGKLLNDTIRGRIPLEGAFEAALEEVRAATALDLPHHESARRTRAAVQSESGVPRPLPASEARDEAAAHELHAIGDPDAGDTGSMRVSRTVAAAQEAPPRASTMASNMRARQRMNVRGVDWTSADRKDD